jgi:hypothetical protein
LRGLGFRVWGLADKPNAAEKALQVRACGPKDLGLEFGI